MVWKYKRLLRSLRAELCSTLLSLPFLLAVGLTALLCLLGGTDSFVMSPSPNILTALFTCSRETLLQDSQLCREGLVLGYTDSLWFVVLLPVLAGLPSVYRFYSEWFSGSYYLSICRQSRKGYSLSKGGTALLSGGFAVGLGVLLFAGIVFLRFPGISAYTNADWFYTAYGNTKAAQFLFFARTWWNTVAVSMGFGLLDNILMVLLRERFLSLTCPMMLQYISNRFTDLYNSRLFQSYQETGDLELFEQKSALTLLLPSNQLTMYVTFPRQTGLSIAIYYLLLLLLLALLLVLFHWLLERRVKHAA